MEPQTPVEVLADGTPVEVRNRFVETWAGGFEVAGAGEAGYRLRRLFDGRVLPDEFPPDEVRRRAEARRWHPSASRSWRSSRSA